MIIKLKIGKRSTVDSSAKKNMIHFFVLILFCEILNKVASTLIFPPTTPTRAQLIVGIGIPLDLETESMTTGYVLKAEYFLPTKSKELRPTMLNPQSINRRSVISNGSIDDIVVESEKYNEESEINKEAFPKSLKENTPKTLSKYRWALYKGVEVIADKMGLIGRACMLRSICEAAEIPFHYESGILSELMHIVMTPSSSGDAIDKHSDYEYYHAENLGRSGAPCHRIFKECKRSLIEFFSAVWHF